MLRVNINRILERLEAIAVYGIDPAGGWSRFSFSDEDLKVRKMVTGWATNLGMAVSTDPAGNLIARLAGKNNSLPPISLGSHFDTVQNGGKFDGAYGIVSAFEAVNVLVENEIKPEMPIEIISFAEEEGSGFGASLFGSKAMAGTADEFYLEKKNEMGLSLGEAMKRVGCDLTKYRSAQRKCGAMQNYLELHIEQGRVLENANVSIGVVEGVVGFKWVKITLKGCSDHAGATPMGIRRDAMAAAGCVIQEVEKIARSIGDPFVATVGKIVARPNSFNIVPGEVEVCLDIRDMSTERIVSALEEIRKSTEKICTERGIQCIFEEIADVAPEPLCPKMADLIEKSARECGYDCMRMYSGAGHDAQLMALITDTGLIFVPSKDGVSHAPEEFTSAENLEKGANVLLCALLNLIKK